LRLICLSAHSTSSALPARDVIPVPSARTSTFKLLERRVTRKVCLLSRGLLVSTTAIFPAQADVSDPSPPPSRTAIGESRLIANPATNDRGVGLDLPGLLEEPPPRGVVQELLEALLLRATSVRNKWRQTLSVGFRAHDGVTPYRRGGRSLSRLA